MKISSYKIKDALLGFATGDALGVPVEFETREHLAREPLKGMVGYMRHNQPPGTWSDDSSMVFCTVESLCSGYDLEDIAVQFSKWKNRRFWTPHGRVFDIGIQTQKAIERIDRFLDMEIHVKPLPEEGVNEKENGNGSLMRILPLAFSLKDKSPEEQFRYVKEVSSLTHPHIRAVIGCFIYVQYILGILRHRDKNRSYSELQESVPGFLDGKADPAEIDCYSRILRDNIGGLPDTSIQSSPYVVHTLEATLWSVLRNDSFRDTVLEAVNLGDDTDTIGALSGAAAGLIYGSSQIPAEWLEVLARRQDIIDLAERFAGAIGG
jgi:ADP-ribosyl-[dinitrogen reductase] hydrolase